MLLIYFIDAYWSFCVSVFVGFSVVSSCQMLCLCLDLCKCALRSDSCRSLTLCVFNFALSTSCTFVVFVVFHCVCLCCSCWVQCCRFVSMLMWWLVFSVCLTLCHFFAFPPRPTLCLYHELCASVCDNSEQLCVYICVCVYFCLLQNVLCVCVCVHK